MKREVLNDWLIALRSGNYEQGIDFLCQNNKFCCLGVFLDVIKDPYETKNYSGSDIRIYDGCFDTGLPSNVCKKYKFNGNLGESFTNEITKEYTSLADLNDNRLSFNKIADIIETNPEHYFEIED